MAKAEFTPWAEPGEMGRAAGDKSTPVPPPPVRADPGAWAAAWERGRGRALPPKSGVIETFVIEYLYSAMFVVRTHDPATTLGFFGERFSSGVKARALPRPVRGGFAASLWLPGLWGATGIVQEEQGCPLTEQAWALASWMHNFSFAFVILTVWKPREGGQLTQGHTVSLQLSSVSNLSQGLQASLGILDNPVVRAATGGSEKWHLTEGQGGRKELGTSREGCSSL